MHTSVLQDSTTYNFIKLLPAPSPLLHHLLHTFTAITTFTTTSTIASPPPSYTVWLTLPPQVVHETCPKNAGECQNDTPHHKFRMYSQPSTPTPALTISDCQADYTVSWCQAVSLNTGSGKSVCHLFCVQCHISQAAHLRTKVVNVETMYRSIEMINLGKM